MEAKCTRLLKQLKAFADEIYDSIDTCDITEPDSGLLRDVAETEGRNKDSDFSRLSNLLKKLETVGETSKSIRQEYLMENFESEYRRVSTDEDKTTESSQETPLSSERPVEEDASTGEDETAESTQETPLPSERPVEEDASTGEDKTAESAQETPLPSERPVEEDANTGEDKTAESTQETPLPSERPVEEDASTGKDKTAESSQETSLPSERPVEEDASTGEDKTAESSQDNFQFAERSVETPKERKTFRVLMDISNFLRNELYVKILGKYLVVHGEHETILDEHGKVSRKFTRKFEIPENVDTETFRALFDPYKVLIIEASFKSMNDQGGAYEVPIYEETDGEQTFSPFKSLEPDFQELMESHIKDARFMRDFVRKLLEQRPSDYIPVEEVI